MNPIENILGVKSRRMNVDLTWDTDEFRMNVLCAWECCMDKSEYLENLSRSMHNKLFESNRNKWSLNKI